MFLEGESPEGLFPFFISDKESGGRFVPREILEIN